MQALTSSGGDREWLDTLPTCSLDSLSSSRPPPPLLTKQFGPAYKLCFGPKSFIVISDPVMIRHILRDNAKAYDKGVLAEILEPIMGKGLIPADAVTWKKRRRAIVPGFHKAWLNAMVRSGLLCLWPVRRGRGRSWGLIMCACA